jgi:uncharacterized sodium:solute symporter family permease YidK
MAKITIDRPFEWCNQSDINIYIDDEKVGEINSGKTIDFEVLPTTHKVSVKKKILGFNKPLLVDMSNDENKTIRVTSMKYGRVMAPVLLLAMFAVYLLTANFLDIQKYFVGVIIVYVLLVFLFMHFNSKHHYYKMEEVEKGITD